ncbi:MAG: class I SAM-dependent methyltransferase [Formivibrio sp.]|nr:class I SAM-dependent methyltransferase [Formivibrio sp.]
MVDEQIKNYRDRIYGSYNSARTTPLAPTTLNDLRSRLPSLRRLVQDHVPADRDSHILEIGCGHGALLYVLEQQGYRNLRGVDGSKEQVEASKILGVKSVVEGDLLDALAATPDGSCDVVIAFDVIEHFTKNELLHLIDDVRRVLKTGGRWIVHVPNAESPFGSRILYSDFTHEVAFTRTSIDQLMRASGFSDVICVEDTPTPHGIKSLIRAVLWKLIRFMLLFFIAVETGSFDRSAIFSQNFQAICIK